MQLLLPLFIVTATVVIYLATHVVNELLFVILLNLEIAGGINLVYLPAGMRLLCLLLFGGWGAVGILLASWIATFGYHFPEPDQFARAFAGGIISALAPYLVYKWAQYRFGLASSLSNLTASRLLFCILAYAFMSPFMHQLFAITQGTTDTVLTNFIAMFVGDLVGSLVVIYAFRAIVARRGSSPAHRTK